MAAAPCDDANNLVNAWASYAYEVAVPPPGACCANRRRCPKMNSTNHRDAAGNVINPFQVCLNCKTRGGAVSKRHRRPIAAPAAAPFNIRARGTLLDGQRGAWNRGRLCDRCVNLEIAAYFNRRYVGRKKTADQAANTCKCEKELRKYYCVRDMIDACARIQNATDRNAGPGGWLEHLEYQPAQNRARSFAANAAFLNRRQAGGFLRNACRCGRDVPLPPAGQANHVPVPVAACTACSGIIVDHAHPMVTNFVQNWDAGYQMGQDEANMDYGRPA
jgi:hypothetical protein